MAADESALGGSAPAGPLDGAPVLEWGSGLSLSFATKWMAALGAEVIKVEPPAGDPMRPTPPGRTTSPPLPARAAISGSSTPARRA